MGRNILSTRCKNAKVFFRIVPRVQMHWEHVKILEDMKTLYIRDLQDFGVGREGCIPSYWKFNTDGIFYNTTQDEIYETVMEEVLERVIEGCDAVILAYGQTGSGKSLTVNGLWNSFKDRGIGPRLISNLFHQKKLLKHKCKMCIQMSYIETKKIYVTDLLNPDGELLDNHGLKKITVLKVKNEHAALKTLFEAEGRREYSENFSNKHTANGVLTMHVTTRPFNQNEPTKTLSKIHIVDLAGVDTYGNSTSLHKNIFDLANGNLAKSQLEQFILILCENIPEKTLAKQRLNVLIEYLADSLTTHTILRCIGHLRTDRENLLITISLLRFGQIVRSLRPQKLHFNIVQNEETELRLMEEKLVELEKENDIKVMLTDCDLSTNITQERIKHMQHVAEEYLQDKTNELVLLNVTDTNTVLKVFKDLFNKLEIEKVQVAKTAYDKAYEEALINFRNLPPTDSVLSQKSSHKSSLRSRSKEGSVDNAARQSGGKKTARGSLPKTPSKLSAHKGKLDMVQNLQKEGTKSLKRSKTSSLNMPKKPSAGKRRSQSSTATAGTGSITEVQLPDSVLFHEEAWNLFVNDSIYNYDELRERANLEENLAKEAHELYLDEVHTLQKLLDIVEIRKAEVQKAQMQRLLQKEVRDQDGTVVISDLESLCHGNLAKAHAELVEQQEKVLKSQTEFRITLDAYKYAKNNINEQYDLFCLETFHTSVPNLVVPSMHSLEQSAEIVSSDVEESHKNMYLLDEEIAHFDQLKHLMKVQMRKKIYKTATCKKWIQSCKT